MRTSVAVFILSIACWVSEGDRSSLQQILCAHKWRAPDGSGMGIKRNSALNPTIGFLARKLYVDVDSVLLHPFPVRVSIPKEVYLYVLGDYNDIFFDSKLTGKDEEELKGERVFLGELLGHIRDRDRMVRFFAELITVGLAEADYARWGIPVVNLEKHAEMIRLLVEYLSRPEEPYIVGGRVDINKFLGSKTFLMQAMISKYIGENHILLLCNTLYERFKNRPDILGRYYSSKADDLEDSRYEELMKRHGTRFILIERRCWQSSIPSSWRWAVIITARTTLLGLQTATSVRYSAWCVLCSMMGGGILWSTCLMQRVSSRNSLGSMLSRSSTQRK
jgi:hypothetical protein